MFEFELGDHNPRPGSDWSRPFRPWTVSKLWIMMMMMMMMMIATSISQIDDGDDDDIDDDNDG